MAEPAGGVGAPTACTLVPRHFQSFACPSKNESAVPLLCTLEGRFHQTHVPAGRMPMAPLSMLRGSSSQKTDFLDGPGDTISIALVMRYVSPGFPPST